MYEILTVVGIAVVSGAGGAVGRELIYRRNNSKSKLCPAHEYIEKKIMYHGNYMRWMGGLLYRLCEKQDIDPPREPMEE